RQILLRHAPAGGRSWSLVLAATPREREQCNGDADGASHAASFRSPAMHTSICTVNEGTTARPVQGDGRREVRGVEVTCGSRRPVAACQVRRATRNPKRGKWTTSVPTAGSLRRIAISSTDDPTNVPATGSKP